MMEACGRKVGPLHYAILVVQILWIVSAVVFARTVPAEHARAAEANLEAWRQRFTEQRVWGQPGLGLDGQEVFGEKAAYGSFGERQTAHELDSIDLPDGLVIFHGLRFIGSEKADVDHALVMGNRVLLLDSKRWKSNATYSWDRYGQVLRDGQPFLGGEVHMANAVQNYKDYLGPEADVFAAIVLTADGNDYVPGTSNDGCPFELRLTTVDHLDQQVAWIADSNHDPMNVPLLLKMFDALKAK